MVCMCEFMPKCPFCKSLMKHYPQRDQSTVQAYLYIEEWECPDCGFIAHFRRFRKGQ